MLRFLQRWRESLAPRLAVLCYGDSNTWGTVPCGGQFPHEKCWCGVMERALGRTWNVIREGLPGRTACTDDGTVPGLVRNGAETFKMLLISHAPLAACIIMLGTNDCKAQFDFDAARVAQGLLGLAGTALTNWGYGPPPPRVLLFLPPLLTERSRAWGFATGPERMAQLRASLEKERNRREHDPRISILFADDYVADESEDGIHMTERSHDLFGRAMASLLQQPA